MIHLRGQMCLFTKDVSNLAKWLTALFQHIVLVWVRQSDNTNGNIFTHFLYAIFQNYVTLLHYAFSFPFIGLRLSPSKMHCVTVSSRWQCRAKGLGGCCGDSSVPLPVASSPSSWQQSALFRVSWQLCDASMLASKLASRYRADLVFIETAAFALDQLYFCLTCKSIMWWKPTAWLETSGRCLITGGL